MMKCFNCGYEIPKEESRIYLDHTICEDCSTIVALASLKDMGVSKRTINELEKCMSTIHEGREKD